MSTSTVRRVAVPSAAQDCPPSSGRVQGSSAQLRGCGRPEQPAAAPGRGRDDHRRRRLPEHEEGVEDVLGHRVAQSPQVRGIDGLALSMLIAAVVALPIGVGQAVPAFVDPIALAAGFGVGVSSSVIPYVCDQLAMARLTRSAYALMVALLPATATVIGIVVLAQIPTVVEVVGVALVVAGVAVHREPTAGAAPRSAAGRARSTP
jgi:hypothetical protein